MPYKAIPIDREEVKTTFLATGSLSETARLHNLKTGTIRQWAKRYQWPTPHNLLKQIGEAKATLKTLSGAQGREVTNVTAGQALEEHLANSTKTFRSGMATALSRIGETAGTMDGLTALDNARRLKDASDIAKVVLGIGADADAPRLQVNLLNLSASSFSGS
jgi:hypothetical protein